MNTTMQFAPKEVMARKDLDIRAGDTVRVHLKIQEKGKTRIQMFEGLVIAKKHGSEPGATFTVRKISNGVGIERIFPLYSPAIEKIEVVKRARVRQSKLYYIRTKVARDIRRKMRNLVDYTATTDDLVVPADEMLDEAVPEEETKDKTPEVNTEEGATSEASAETNEPEANEASDTEVQEEKAEA